MNKGFLVLILAAVAAAGAFAQPKLEFSAGLGGFFTSDFGGGYDCFHPSNYHVKGITPYAGGGGFAFFDATFVELSLGFFAARGVENEYHDSHIFSSEKMSYTGLDIGLLGKYPFALGERFTLFPLLGFAYRHFTLAKRDGTRINTPGDFSAFWFKFGGGVDYAVTGTIYVRLGVVYGIRLANEREKGELDYYKNSGFPTTETSLGHGPDIKLAIGYKY
jgi:opacity protein-like surface antigen